jgi:hypothetical protein
MMSLARKLILHSPISDETLLEDFVERCLAGGVSLLAIFGPDCEVLEEKVDCLVVADGSQPSRFLCTTSHRGESLDEVLSMVNAWEPDRDSAVEQVHI